MAILSDLTGPPEQIPDIAQLEYRALGIAVQNQIPLSGVLTVPNGGTGQQTYTVGDLLYASAANNLAKLADVATGNALISGGVATAPSWGKIGLTTHVAGILPAANGGTGIDSSASTGLPYLASAGVWSVSTTQSVQIAHIGVNAAANSNSGINAAATIATTGTNSLRAFGVGTPGDADTEFIDIFHNGAGNSEIDVIKTGAGSFRTLNIRTGGNVTITCKTDQTVQMPHYGVGTATFDGAGNLSSVSDERKKDILGDFTGGLHEVVQIKPIRYKLKDAEIDYEYAGFSAQQLLSLIPHAVGSDADGFYTLDVRPIVAALVNAVKKLHERIAELEFEHV